MEKIWSAWHSDIIALLSALISLMVLFTYLFANRTGKKQYHLARYRYLEGNSILKYVSTKQHDGYFSVKLVLFNPNDIPIVIEALSVLKHMDARNPIKKLLKVHDRKLVSNFKWWPNYYEDRNELFMADEYQSLLVRDQCDIQVVIPGLFDKSIYCFRIDTNRGWVEHMTSIDATWMRFPVAFKLLR